MIKSIVFNGKVLASGECSVTDSAIVLGGVTYPTGVMQGFALVDGSPQGDLQPGHFWVVRGDEFLQVKEQTPPDISEQADKKLSSVNAIRDQLEASGFPYLGRVFDSDERSVARINTTVQAAFASLSSGTEFSVEWTCADNSVIELDAQQMIGVPVALALYGDKLHRHAKALKEQIRSAQTEAQLAEVDISTGWPALDEAA